MTEFQCDRLPEFLEWLRDLYLVWFVLFVMLLFFNPFSKDRDD